MCYWYAHEYTCKHVTYALGKYCSTAGLVQTPCKKKNIWQRIRMGEDCEDCAMPANRTGSSTTDAVADTGVQQKVGVRTKKPKARKRWWERFDMSGVMSRRRFREYSGNELEGVSFLGSTVGCWTMVVGIWVVSNSASYMKTSGAKVFAIRKFYLFNEQCSTESLMTTFLILSLCICPKSVSKNEITSSPLWSHVPETVTFILQPPQM